MTTLLELAERCEAATGRKPRFSPSECPYCAYDRRFPGFEAGGWIQQDNNGPIVSCPVCNDDGSFPFDAPELVAAALKSRAETESSHEHD